MPDPAPSAASDGPAVPDGPPAARAAAWQALSHRLASQRRLAEALVAVRTAQALWERLGDESRAGACRAFAGELTGNDLVLLEVGVAPDDPAADPDEVRAVWLGSPADGALAMMGWVERGGALQVVRVVVPGTGRGRGAFRTLLTALPRDVQVRMHLPARDRELTKVARRAGFSVADPPGGEPATRGRYVGGAVVAAREPR